MREREPVLGREYDDQLNKHTKANLLVRLEKLLQYDGNDLDSLAFKRNFKDCQMMYEELQRVEE